MATPILNPAQVKEIAARVSAYIASMREEYGRKAAPLGEAVTRKFAGFFAESLLGSTRTAVISGRRVKEPDFYPQLAALGFANLPSFSGMAAITFGDVIVSHQPFSDRLLFHELVHVEQYRQLGIEKFATLYVRGFLQGGSYDAIPLERNAYELDALSMRGHSCGFLSPKSWASGSGMENSRAFRNPCALRCRTIRTRGAVAQMDRAAVS